MALRLCTPNGPPAAESCGPPPALCHGTQPRGVTSPWRMASPHRGAWHHPAMAHSHTALARGATNGSPALGWGKGAWGHPSGVPVSLTATGTRVPSWGPQRQQGTTAIQHRRQTHAPRPAPAHGVRTEHRPLIPPKAPRLGADTSHTPLGTHRSRMGTAAGRAARPSPGRREPGEERTSPG